MENNEKYMLLRSISFGQRVAEEESDSLATYFVETDQWVRLFRGDIDIIYGPKGSGKSALYSLLIANSSDLFDRNIILVPAENPRGGTAFRDIATDPPTTEREFVGLWKLYILSLLHSVIVEYAINTDAARQLDKALVRDGLVKGHLSLAGLLQRVRAYIVKAFRPQSVEGTFNVDPATQLPSGFTGKITFVEPSAPGHDPELHSVDSLLELANQALTDSKTRAWVLFDRLDVAFVEKAELESNALRALFRVYLDFGSLSNVTLKIFLRTDIWARITSQGFREASHITRHLTVSWNRNSLLNLVVRRSVHNESLRKAFSAPDDLAKRSMQEQELFFFKMCPDQVDVGPNKPNTFDWLLSRTRDGLKANAPRELIHLLNSLREVQVKRFEIGEPSPEGDIIFSRPAFKDALPEVSKVRLEQTLYAEYPELKESLEKLRGEKTAHTPDTLASVWSVSREEAIVMANQLATIGFFEKRGTTVEPEYWVPFLYRDGLDMVQGAAETGTA
jgi:hypothetical protein